MEYSGWTNKATWLVNVWYGDFILDAMQESKKHWCGLEIQAYVDEIFFDTLHVEPVISDFLNALHIDWDQLADTYNQDIDL